MRHLLDAIGHPEASIPNFVHIGGTSGKGTVTMGIAEGLRASGTKVAAYTSPHITTTVERFWVDGNLMSSKRYVELVAWIKPILLQEMQTSPFGLPSFFEIEFAMALEHFRREGVEWAVIEVGCGGEFDATNTIPPPRATVITNIGLDHTDILGTTKRVIAKTKAGIIKPGSHVFTSESSPAIRRILKQRAEQEGATFTFVSGKNHELIGRVLEDMGPLRQIGPMKLHGRFERLQTNPLVVLDVAHNPDKCAYAVGKWKMENGKTKPHVLFAVAANKDRKGMLKSLVEIAKSITFVPFSSGSRECANPADLQRIAKKLNPSLKTNVFLSSDEGLDYLLNKKEPILITGSFFLAGDLRKRWISEAKILKTRSSFGKERP